MAVVCVQKEVLYGCEWFYWDMGQGSGWQPKHVRASGG